MRNKGRSRPEILRKLGPQRGGHSRISSHSSREKKGFIFCKTRLSKFQYCSKSSRQNQPSHRAQVCRHLPCLMRKKSKMNPQPRKRMPSKIIMESQNVGDLLASLQSSTSLFESYLRVCQQLQKGRFQFL